MAQLTNEQIKRAHEAWLEAVKFPPEEITASAQKAILAMAPHLQLPWELPTHEEASQIRDFMLGQALDRYHVDTVEKSLAVFVKHRNAKLHPKPVDPRREKIIRAVDVFDDYPTAEQLADRILAALDEVE